MTRGRTEGWLRDETEVAEKDDDPQKFAESQLFDPDDYQKEPGGINEKSDQLSFFFYHLRRNSTTDASHSNSSSFPFPSSSLPPP